MKKERKTGSEAFNSGLNHGLSTEEEDKNDLFNVYVDEAAAFLNLENADLITRTFQETAKFGMSLTLINQSYDTIPPVVRKTLSTNVAALMYFAMGVGSGDAKIAKAELHGLFEEEELNALPVGRAAVRLGNQVFSVASPDVKTPPNSHTEELMAYALQKHGVPTAQAGRPRALTGERYTAGTDAGEIAKGGAAHATDREAGTPSNARQPKPMDLSKLQGERKRQAVLRVLAVCGLVPLSDLNAAFFPGSAAYGRQFLKKMAKENAIGAVKLGKRSAYHLTTEGGKALKNQRRYEPFALPEERLWEHAAMTGGLGARLCALAAKRCMRIELKRETNWKTVRPDLLVTWREGARAGLLLVEADRATESVATFRKEKLEPYSRALGGGRGKEDVRLWVVVPDEKRKGQLREATRKYPVVMKAASFSTLEEWAAGGEALDIFGSGNRGSMKPHRTAQKEGKSG